MRRIKVIANCHCLPLADALALCVPGVNTDFIDVNFVRTPDMQARIADMHTAPSGQIVYTQPLSDQFDSISTVTLRQQFGSDGVTTFTNVHFNGLHPDITYLGQMGSRIENFFGPYHSKLVLYCFVSGRSITDCLKMFDGAVYEKIGYLGAFQSSSEELMARDQSIDAQFAAQFLEMTLHVPTMYTVNHPTGRVFLALAETMATKSGLKFVRHSPEFFQNHLSTSYIWPIYDAIAEHSHLAYRTKPYFIKILQRDTRVINFAEFVTGCYLSYEAAEPDELRQAVTALPFYQNFSAALKA
jgi:hypothetical protein